MAEFPISGYHGRVLVADLGRGEARTEPLDPNAALDYLGGRGLATRGLYDIIAPACAPLVRGGPPPPAVDTDLPRGRAETLPADHVWGKTTHETNDVLSAVSEPGNPARVLCIGPAGENRVRFPPVPNDRAG